MFVIAYIQIFMRKHNTHMIYDPVYVPYQIITVHDIVNVDVCLIAQFLRVSYVALGQHEVRGHIPLIVQVHCHITDRDVEFLLYWLHL